MACAATYGIKREFLIRPFNHNVITKRAGLSLKDSYFSALLHCLPLPHHNCIFVVPQKPQPFILACMIRDAIPSYNNFYEATAQRDVYPSLQGEMHADVCIIGGGITGCSTALHLSQMGYRVVLLESNRIGHGASGRSGGQLLPGYSCGQPALQRQLGKDDAHRLWDISVEAVQLAIALIRQHHIDCDLQFGHLDVALKPRHRDELLEHQQQLSREYHYQTLKMIEGDELLSLVNSHRYIAGLHDSACAHIHPLNYTLGLAGAASRAGALLYEQSSVVGIDQSVNVIGIRTEHGKVNANQIVLCANVDNVEVGRQSPRIMPVATCMIATEPLSCEVVKPDIAVSDCNFILDYFRMSNSRLLFGGGVSYSGHATSFSMRHIQQRMLRVFPQLHDVKIEYAWYGLLDISMNRAPDFGRIGNNVYYLQGFSGHGLALATMAGKLVAGSIAMQNERFDLFSRIKHRPFPGGPLRTPLLMLAMLWYRFRDLM